MKRWLAAGAIGLAVVVLLVAFGAGGALAIRTLVPGPEAGARAPIASAPVASMTSLRLPSDSPRDLKIGPVAPPDGCGPGHGRS